MSKTSLHALGMTLLIVVVGVLIVMFGGATMSSFTSWVQSISTDESAFRGFVVVMLFILLIRDIFRPRP